jgi:hypothetical protein
MPYTDSGLWVPREPHAHDRIGDANAERRPHWIAILLSLIYTAVTGGAVVVAVFALRDDTKAFEIGNRPFLVAHRGALDFDANGGLQLTIDIENGGGTEMKSLEIRTGAFAPQQVGGGGTLRTRLLKIVGDIDPKATFARRYSIGADDDYFTFGVLYIYSDIFGNDWVKGICRTVDATKRTIKDDCDTKDLTERMKAGLIDLSNLPRH